MPNELNRHLQLNAPQEGNLLNQYVDALRPYISIDGGISGSVKDSNITLPGDDGHIRSMNIGGGGRAGVKIPINELIMRLGASGYFSKHRTEFDSNMQGVGAPDQVSGYDAGLTGLDAATASMSVLGTTLKIHAIKKSCSVIRRIFNAQCSKSIRPQKPDRECLESGGYPVWRRATAGTTAADGYERADADTFADVVGISSCTSAK